MWDDPGDADENGYATTEGGQRRARMLLKASQTTSAIMDYVSHLGLRVGVLEASGGRVWLGTRSRRSFEAVVRRFGSPGFDDVTMEGEDAALIDGVSICWEAPIVFDDSYEPEWNYHSWSPSPQAQLFSTHVDVMAGRVVDLRRSQESPRRFLFRTAVLGSESSALLSASVGDLVLVRFIVSPRGQMLVRGQLVSLRHGEWSDPGDWHEFELVGVDRDYFDSQGGHHDVTLRSDQCEMEISG